MEEVQSWWEVPAVAHFCYVFRSSFNLFYFEIAELESALLNIQDPDMSISLDQLITRLLQGCYDEESVNEDNWEEKLHELFNDNLEGDENPFGDSYFYQLSPRSKIEILMKLCELRLDVEGAMDEIKNIPSEDMQAKCMGKDVHNNTYWYFCDERLYKEPSSAGKKSVQPSSNKNAKTNTNKNRQSTREKRNKTNINVDKSWMIACFNISDWENLLKSFSKSKSSQEKELFAAIERHLSLLEEKVSEKDRLLRKRFLELAPKRSSSRISKVQEKKRQDMFRVAEEAKKAKEAAEKERSRKEALMLKEKKESRQKRAEERQKAMEERQKAVEERAERAKLREMARSEDSDSSEDEKEAEEEEEEEEKEEVEEEEEEEDGEEEEKDDDDDSSIDNEYIPYRKNQIKRIPSVCRTEQNGKAKSKDSNVVRTNKKKYRKRTEKSQYDYVSAQIDTNRYHRTYSSPKPKSSPQSPFHSNKSERSKANYLVKSKEKLRHQHATQSAKTTSDESENSCSSNSSSDINSDSKNFTNVKDLPSALNSSRLSSNCSGRSQEVNNKISRVAIYKSPVLQKSPDLSKWNAAFGPPKQKSHILYSSQDNLASKKIKLEKVNFRAVSPNMKSSLSKENHMYKPVHQTSFITYGKIIPSAAIVKLEYRKPPNPQVSS